MNEIEKLNTFFKKEKQFCDWSGYMEQFIDFNQKDKIEFSSADINNPLLKHFYKIPSPNDISNILLEKKVDFYTSWTGCLKCDLTNDIYFYVCFTGGSMFYKL